MFGKNRMMNWTVRHSKLEVSKGGILMGILNVTPDSFSDGGAHNAPMAALQHAMELEKQGALIIDIGGESTRPGSDEVSEEEELNRVIPAIKLIRKHSDILLSIDTRHPSVAHEALKAGVDILNDIEGFRDARMIELAKEFRAGAVIMHMQGQPKTMQANPQYDDVVEEVKLFFEEMYQRCLDGGMDAEQICWDPGIGFGKSLTHNLALIAHLKQLQVKQRPVLLGLSRKRMLNIILDEPQMNLREKDMATAVMTVLGHQKGASIHRVHDIRACAQALKLQEVLDFAN